MGEVFGVTCARPEGQSRTWQADGAVHIDVRGLDPPEPMVAILRAIDSGEADTVLVAYLDREPIFLYPELDERGWSHELMPSSCGSPDCEDGVTLHMERWGA